MSKVSVSVSISDDQIDRFSEVVDQARAAGLEVWQELDLIGVVSGSIDEERMDELRGLPGVAAVEPERDFEIAPPESEIQSLPEGADEQWGDATSDGAYDPAGGATTPEYEHTSEPAGTESD